MPRQRTNILHHYISEFSEAELVRLVSAASSRSSSVHIRTITNPVVRFLAASTRVSGRKIYCNFDIHPDTYERIMFNMVGKLLKDLSVEIEANPSYKVEVKRALLSNQEGPMLTVLNELIVAGYYKSLGKAVKLNSSRESGMPDIELTDTPYASDVKLFPNRRLQLEAMVNTSGPKIYEAFKHFPSESILIFIFSPVKTDFNASIAQASNQIKSSNVLHYMDATLNIVNAPPNYSGGDMILRLENENTIIHLQASWPMDDAITKLKQSVTHSIAQARNADKEAITWVMFPKDARRSGIEITTLRFSGAGSEIMSENPGLYVMPVYSIDIDDGRVGFMFDIHQTGSNTFGINEESFKNYAQTLANVPEILMRV